MGAEEAVRESIIVADAGPLLHLHWVGALEWSLPPQTIEVVESVWQEVRRHAPRILADSRLRRVADPVDVLAEVENARLDAGERAALAYAASVASRAPVLVLCDERGARAVCARLSLPVTGSIGLIVAAAVDGRVARRRAVRALRQLSTRGRLYVSDALVEQAVQAVKQDQQPDA